MWRLPEWIQRVDSLSGHRSQGYAGTVMRGALAALETAALEPVPLEDHDRAFGPQRP